MARIVAILVIVGSTIPAAAQTLDDGLLMSSRALCTGFVYMHDSWNEYWEGSLLRDNENIGTLTTQSIAWMGAYGVTPDLTVVAMLPYVWTEASDGPLHGMDGFQDLTIGAKYRLLSTPFTSAGTMRAFVSAAFATPVSAYTPDFLPMSIGLHSRRLSGRFILNFETPQGIFANGSTAYTWRANVELERESYFTNDRLYLTNEVQMPAVFDYNVSVGYRKGRLMVPLSLAQQRTLGGSDIRRNDMPFVSNQMDFVRLDATVMYTLPVPENLLVRAGVSRVVSGRNVGQSTTLSAGLLYTINF
ncbi:MAG TPA: transporter [Rhodothermales bacterium]